MLQQLSTSKLQGTDDGRVSACHDVLFVVDLSWRAPLHPSKKPVSWKLISVQSTRIRTFWALWDRCLVFNRRLRAFQCSLRTIQQSILSVKPSVESSTDRDFTDASSVVFLSDPAGDRGRIRFPERVLMVELTYRSRSENRPAGFLFGSTICETLRIHDSHSFES